MPKALNPKGCVHDSAISSSYNKLLFLVWCLSVKNDPIVFKSYFILFKLVTFSVRYTEFALRLLLFDKFASSHSRNLA